VIESERRGPRTRRAIVVETSQDCSFFEQTIRDDCFVGVVSETEMLN